MHTEIHLDGEECQCFSLQEPMHQEKAISKQEDSDSEFSSTCPTSTLSTEENYQMHNFPPGDEDCNCSDDDVVDNFHHENFHRQPFYHILSNSAPYAPSNAGPGSTSKSLTVRNKRQDFFDRLLSSTSEYDETIDDNGIFSDRREDFLLSPVKMFLKPGTSNIDVIERRDICVENCTGEGEQLDKENEDAGLEDEPVQHEEDEEDEEEEEVEDEEQDREVDSAAAEQEGREAEECAPDNIDCLRTPLGIDIDTIDFSLGAITTGEFGIWSPDMQQRRRSASSSISNVKNSAGPAVGRFGRVRHRLQRNIHNHSPSTDSTYSFPSPCSAFLSPPYFRRRSEGEAIRGPGSASKSLIVEESERQLALSDILLAPMELMLTLPGEKTMKSIGNSSKTQTS